jgi:hypothetical protein
MLVALLHLFDATVVEKPQQATRFLMTRTWWPAIDRQTIATPWAVANMAAIIAAPTANCWHLRHSGNNQSSAKLVGEICRKAALWLEITGRNR